MTIFAKNLHHDVQRFWKYSSGFREYLGWIFLRKTTRLVSIHLFFTWSSVLCCSLKKPAEAADKKFGKYLKICSSLVTLQAVSLQIYQKIKFIHMFLFTVLAFSAVIIPWILKPVDKFPKNYMWKILFYGKVEISINKTSVLNRLLKLLKPTVRNTSQ